MKHDPDCGLLYEDGSEVCTCQANTPNQAPVTVEQNNDRELGPLWRSVHAVHCQAMSDGVSATAYRKRMLAALAPPASTCPDAGAEGWRDISSAPKDGTPFLAAIKVTSLDGSDWNEVHLIWCDDETGDVHNDCDQGWQIDYYSHCMPLPAPPAAMLAASEQERGS